MPNIVGDGVEACVVSFVRDLSGTEVIKSQLKSCFFPIDVVPLFAVSYVLMYDFSFRRLLVV